MKTKKNFLKKLTAGILGFVMTLGVGAAGYAASANESRAVVGEEHEIAFDGKDTGVLLNYGEKPADITVSAPSYPIKQVKINWKHNKSNDGITAAVTVGGTSLGSGTIGGTNTTKDTLIGDGTKSLTGEVKIAFTNSMSGSGKGTLYLYHIYLIEGDSGGTSQYTVTFNANGHGTAPSAVTVSAGGTVTKPNNPTADGYTFGGWYTESGCTNEYNFSSAVNSSFTLYAKWTQNSGGGTKTYQFITANGNTFGTSTSTSKALNTVNWNISTATNLGSYNSGNYAGQQLGTKDNAGAIELETVNNWGEQSGTTWSGYKKVKKVYLWLNNGTGTVGTYDVKVDGTSCSKSGTVTKNNTAGSDYTQTSRVTYTPQSGHDMGKVKINVTSSSKAIYFCAIEIECEEVAVAKYSVTNNSGNTVIFGGTTGANAAQNDTDYTATITAATGYNQVSISSIVVGSTTLSSSDYTFNTSSGLLTIPKAKINDDITITAVGSKASYTVSASGTGVTFSSTPNATYLTQYQISFDVQEGYDAPSSVSVKIGGAEVAGVTYSNKTITVPAAGVTGNLTITADATLKTYTLSISGLQNINFDQETGSSLEHGKTFAGTLTPVTGYTLDGATITVTMGDEDITSDVLADDYIQIDEVTGDIVITGSGVKVQDPVIDIDNDEFRIEENATATLTVEYSLATLTSASAVLDTGKDVVTFGTLNPSTGKITLTPKAKGEGYYTLTVNYVNTNTSASDSKDFDVYVEVYGDELTGISLSSYSGDYYLGDNVVHPTVTAHYSLTGDRPVSASWDDSAYDKYHTGSYELIASYNGETATYTANVAAKSYTTKGEDTHVYTYDKVTSSQTDWRGKYLIVYETDSLAMDGSLETLDAVSNTKSVTISNNSITTDADGKIDGNAIYFTVDYKGTSTSIYSLMSASGKYISGTTTSAKAGNGIKQADNPDNYEITFSGTELQSKSSDQQMAMKYNKATDQTRFRFYKSGQEAVALYKWTDHMTPGEDIPSDERHAIRIGNVSCSKSPLIAGDTLDVSDFSIQVQFDTGNDFVDNLVPTEVSPTTIAVGAHDYTVSYTGGYTGETTVQKTISLTGQAAPVLDSIYVTKDNPCDDVFNRLDDFTHEGIHVIAHYTDSTTYPDVDVTESATITPPDMTTAGTKEVSVSYTEGGVTKDTSYSITVNAIHTTSLTLVMKDNSQNVISEGDDGFYEIQPGISYSLAFTGNGDYDSVSVTGGTTNTTVSNNTTLSSTATSNEEVTFTASCDQASLPIKVRVIAAKTVTLDSLTTTSKGASASTNENSGSFSGFITNTASIEITTLNYANPVLDDSELPSALSISGSFSSGKYTGTITANAVYSGTFKLYVSESGGSDSEEISLSFSVVEDTIQSIKATGYQTNYTVGDSFNYSMTVTATYASTSTRVLDASEYDVDAPALTSRGNKTVTVTLDGTSVQDQFDITVAKPGNLNIVTSYEIPGDKSYKLVTDASQITLDGKYALGTTGAFINANAVSSSAYQVSSTPTEFNLEASATTGQYLIKCPSRSSNKYITNSSSTSVSWGAGSSFFFTQEEDTGYFYMQNSQNSNRFLGFTNANLTAVKAYATSNLGSYPLVYLYKYIEEDPTTGYRDNTTISDELYDFVVAYSGENLTAKNWGTVFSSTEYGALDADDKALLKDAVVSSQDGTKVTSGLFADFITKYDQILAMNSELTNYLDRDKLNLSAFINASIGFQFTGLEMKKFEFVFTGEWTTEEKVSSYGFMISKNLDALNACIESKNTTGSGITTFVPEDDEVKCSAGVKTTSADTVYYAVLFYEDANGIHYSLVLEISINGYLQSDQFDINSITDPYAKAAIQAWIASLEK